MALASACKRDNQSKVEVKLNDVRTSWCLTNQNDMKSIVVMAYFLNLGTRLMCVIKFAFQPSYAREKYPSIHIEPPVWIGLGNDIKTNA
jgi:hypothetical protein